MVAAPNIRCDRYTFQGQEHDDEIKGEGNSINYTFRMHDPRLGRFFAVDPLVHQFAWNSPYAFSENRVVDMIELEGLESSDGELDDINRILSYQALGILCRKYEQAKSKFNNAMATRDAAKMTAMAVGTSASVNKNDEALQKRALTAFQNWQDATVKAGNASEELASLDNKIQNFVKGSRLQPTQTFKATVIESDFGAYYGSGSGTLIQIDTKPRTGLWENGVPVAATSAAVGIGTDRSPSESVGLGRGSIVIYNGNSSLCNELNKANLITTDETNISAYKSEDIDGYHFQYWNNDEGGRVKIDAIYDGSIHFVTTGITNFSYSTTVSAGPLSGSFSPVIPIDSNKSMFENILFENQRNEATKKFGGKAPIDSIVKYNKDN